jgi:hypothetical protein
LILLAHDVVDRRVLDGDLGCPGCRQKYPVRNGFADLRADPEGSVAGTPDGVQTEGQGEGQKEALRLAAALGVTEGPGTLLIIGPAARHAGGVVNLVGGIEVVAVDQSLDGNPEEVGVSRLATDPSLPFLPASFRGVLISGEEMKPALAEAVRVLAPPGRLVVLEPTPGLREAAEEMGLSVVLEEERILVARKDDPGLPPLVTLRGLPDRS